MVKIVVDPQIFNIQKYGGISRYYKEVFTHLKRRNDMDIILPLFNSDNVYLANSDLLISEKKTMAFLIKALNVLGISTRTLNKKLMDEQIKITFDQGNFDLFIPTYYDSYFLKFIGNKPFVLTVYDMIHELFPQYFLDDVSKVSVNKKILLEKATKIIAVSNNTKKDILNVYPHIDESKIEVIYHGSSICVNNNVVVDLPENYILFVGVRDYYKNFIFLVEAIHELLMFDSSLKLICAGGGDFKDEEIKFLKTMNLQEKVLQRDFDEKQLGMFYKNAKCFIFPSMYEGFGIPVLESMACGCPIVLSNSSSFPEVAGDAGIYFDVTSKEDLVSKVRLVLNDDDFRNEYVLRGLNQAKRFTWDIAASQCAELYKKAIYNFY